jgi:hypothetical protein
MVPHCFKNAVSGDDGIIQLIIRTNRTLSDIGIRSDMPDSVGPATGILPARVKQVSMDKSHHPIVYMSANITEISCEEGIDYNYLIALRHKTINQMGTYESGSAGYDTTHLY